MQWAAIRLSTFHEVSAPIMDYHLRNIDKHQKKYQALPKKSSFSWGDKSAMIQATGMQYTPRKEKHHEENPVPGAGADHAVLHLHSGG